MTTTLHPAARLRRSGDGNIALGQMAHVICDEHERITRDLGQQNADMWLEALCGLLGGMVEPVHRDADDDIPSTGCPTCDAVLDTLAECHGMSLRGTTAADVAESARDWIGDLLVERDEARAEVELLQRTVREATEPLRRLGIEHCALPSACEMAVAEVERLRAEVASLRHRPTRDELADYAGSIRSGEVNDALDADEPDDGWGPGPWWTHYTNGGASAEADGLPGAQVHRAWPSGWVGVVWQDPRQQGRRSDAFDNARAAMRWCESQPEMADVIATWTSAPTVGATDAGPDAPALIVEGDAAEGAREACAVPAAPVSTAEQRDGETGVDRPSDDLRGPDTEVER